MKNRQKVIEAINKANNPLLNIELEYFLDWENVNDMADAINEAEEIAELDNDRKLLKIIRGVLIDAGAYTVAPDKTCTGGDVRFTYNGKKYDFQHGGGWESWLEREADCINHHE